jgi:hypothetical protein
MKKKQTRVEKAEKKAAFLEAMKHAERSCNARVRGSFDDTEVIPFKGMTQEQLDVVKSYYEFGFYAGYRTCLKRSGKGK